MSRSADANPVSKRTRALLAARGPPLASSGSDGVGVVEVEVEEEAEGGEAAHGDSALTRPMQVRMVPEASSPVELSATSRHSASSSERAATCS